jgi:hypothetical protein
MSHNITLDYIVLDLINLKSHLSLAPIDWEVAVF